ncbi:MAG: DUF6327 family protein [Brumimicrobium sp.]
MDKKKYSSFNEIERDLQILKLEREIYHEKILLNSERLKDNLSPLKVLKNTVLSKGKGVSSSMIMSIIGIAVPIIFKKFKGK